MAGKHPGCEKVAPKAPPHNLIPVESHFLQKHRSYVHKPYTPFRSTMQPRGPILRISNNGAYRSIILLAENVNHILYSECNHIMKILSLSPAALIILSLTSIFPLNPRRLHNDGYERRLGEFTHRQVNHPQEQYLVNVRKSFFSHPVLLRGYTTANLGCLCAQNGDNA